MSVESHLVSEVRLPLPVSILFSGSDGYEGRPAVFFKTVRAAELS